MNITRHWSFAVAATMSLATAGGCSSSSGGTKALTLDSGASDSGVATARGGSHFRHDHRDPGSTRERGVVAVNSRTASSAR